MLNDDEINLGDKGLLLESNVLSWETQSFYFDYKTLCETWNTKNALHSLLYKLGTEVEIKWKFEFEGENLNGSKIWNIGRKLKSKERVEIEGKTWNWKIKLKLKETVKIKEQV